MIRLNDMEFHYFVESIGKKYGINLEKKRVLIECRLAKELEKYHLSGFGEYISLLEQDKDGIIQGEMLNRLTTNYTYFTREPEHFKYLWNQVLPQWMEAGSGSPYQVWCAGCSTGEECYTLAMLFADFKERNPAFTVNILGSDISKEALQQAREGTYALRGYDSIPQMWKDKYCRVLDKKDFTLAPVLKKNIFFRCENLLKPSPVRQRYDLIMCRNVMIYFNPDARKQLLVRLENSLNPGGHLMVGHSELISGREIELENVHTAVYRKPCRQRKEGKNE